MKTFKSYMSEGKMGEIHADIEDHLGKHLQNYKKIGGSEHFGAQTVKTAKHISKLHGIEQKHAQKFVNDYVDSNLKEAVDRRDTVTLDIPFLIRLLEYAREDAKTDMDLHKVVERLINMRKKGVLTMADYRNATSHIREGKEIEEDGIAVPGPTNVTGPQSGTDPVSATAVKPKRQPKTLFSIRRKQPKM